MRKSIVVVLVLLGLLVAGVMPVAAITNGQPDGSNHPYVGLVVLIDADGFPLWRCSGSLISEDRFLTAGHCTAPDGPDVPAKAAIWFGAGPILTDQNFLDGDGTCNAPDIEGYPCVGDASGTPYTNPDYNAGNPYGGGNGLPAFAYRDVGVIVLDDPVSMDEYAKLPEAGQVDTLRNKTAIDFVGYGVQYQAQIPGKFLPQPPPYYRWAGPRERMYAPSQLISGKFIHSAEFMRLALNPGGGSGGTCFGDSGGPDLLGGTNIVLAVNSYVTNVNCSGVGYSSRVDIPEVLDWINGEMR